MTSAAAGYISYTVYWPARHICPGCGMCRYVEMSYETGGWDYMDEDAPWCSVCNIKMEIADGG